MIGYVVFFCLAALLAVYTVLPLLVPFRSNSGWASAERLPLQKMANKWRESLRAKAHFGRES